MSYSPFRDAQFSLKFEQQYDCDEIFHRLMNTPPQVGTLFSEYSEYMSRELREFLEEQGDYAMYGMMRYFMGFVDEDFEPIQTFGGKRFRSCLCLMIADLYKQRDEALCAAMSIELYHNFTLIHDDIVDKDIMRRGRSTVWNIWGIPHAINTGDGQLVLAQNMLARGASRHEYGLAVQQYLGARYLEVIEGQYLDFVLTDEPLGSAKVTEEMYFEMISKKTAVLIGAATESAGIAAGRGSEECEALWDYGYNLGIAYQLCDDTVSIWGNKKTTGKRSYGDIREKKKTLPLLYALEHVAVGRDIITKLYNDPKPIDEACARDIVELMDTTDVYEKMQKVISEYSNRSKDALERLSCSANGKGLLRMVHDALLPDVKGL